MGILRMGPPWSLILELKSKYNLTDFIETGTYHGNTAVEAATHFNKVLTIENSKRIYDDVIRKHGHLQNVDFKFGDSKNVLKTVIPKLIKPAIIWLDGHWCGGETYGQQDQCPLIEEIKIINESCHAHFLFIDDARLFLSPPPLPNAIDQWPNIKELLNTITSGIHNYFITVFEDVLIAAPEYTKKDVSIFCQRFNTIQWREYGKAQNESQFIKGFRQIFNGIRLIFYALGSKLKK